MIALAIVASVLICLVGYLAAARTVFQRFESNKCSLCNGTRYYSSHLWTPRTCHAIYGMLFALLFPFVLIAGAVMWERPTKESKELKQTRANLETKKRIKELEKELGYN